MINSFKTGLRESMPPQARFSFPLPVHKNPALSAKALGRQGAESFFSARSTGIQVLFLCEESSRRFAFGAICGNV